MKKLFLPLTAAFACFILAACAVVDYEGESLPALSSDTPVKFYLASDLEKMPGVRVLGTAEYTARPTLTSKDIRAILQDAAQGPDQQHRRAAVDCLRQQRHLADEHEEHDQRRRHPRQTEDHLQDVREGRIPVRARNPAARRRQAMTVCFFGTVFRAAEFVSFQTSRRPFSPQTQLRNQIEVIRP